ncbi:hypothetical protein POM88_036040 [Heracleum sosnowskyi]|uniref:Hydroxyproline O-arabinosyltransferase-like domain-containing protein n=1 Tax=Heracleum sosnowskyi TaxID=360622 RepID=A0AAD8MF95_9APIA|nr:hypothetical protein POM88_036040 [Heracleum sosnowskyi]
MPMDRRTRISSFENKKKRMFHTAVTDSEGVYSLWQCRIMYYWFKKFKNGPNSEMGGFTRILHSGFPDDYSTCMRSLLLLLNHFQMDWIRFKSFDDSNFRKCDD